MAATVSSSSAALGFAVRPDEGRDLAEMGAHVIAAANEQLGLSDPEGGGWDHISSCQFAAPLTREGNELQGSNACVIGPGKIDRSPTRTGCSARMAVLSAHGQMAEGDVYRARSIIGSEFVCQIARRATIRDRPTIVPIISGRAWITGVSQYMLDPADPWPLGYRLSDTWSRNREAI
jgi:trans-L-3-hydroxyproline dehydratase